jgi:hypothetical protein
MRIRPSALFYTGNLSFCRVEQIRSTSLRPLKLPEPFPPVGCPPSLP